MILHLERKFTAPTETFIANQINFQNKYKSIVFTVKQLNNLPVNATIFESAGKSFLPLNLLTREQVGSFFSIYNRERPSLIHGHFLTDSSFFHPFSKKINIPKVCSGYGYDVSNFPKRYFGFGKFYFKNLFKEYTVIVAMSTDMADDIIQLGCPASKVIVHYYGTDTQYFNFNRTFEDKEFFNILTIASLVPKKGHLTVLKALKHLKSQFPHINFKYMIVGDGPLLASLKKYINENGLEKQVTFLGLIKHGKELMEIIQSADVFVHPSVTDRNGGKEGIPGTIVEAMASGLPVISTYHAGIPEIITDKHDGLLIKEDNYVELSDLIYQLYNNSGLRSKLGENAKNTATTKLDIRIKNEELIKIYDRLIN